MCVARRSRAMQMLFCGGGGGLLFERAWGLFATGRPAKPREGEFPERGELGWDIYLKQQRCSNGQGRHEQRQAAGQSG